MSPPPTDPDSSRDIIQNLKEGGFTASLIGIAGMIARLLLSDGRTSLGGAIRHVLAAGIVAYFVDQGLQDQNMARGLKVACVGISGATATEIVEWAVRAVKGMKRPASDGSASDVRRRG